MENRNIPSWHTDSRVDFQKLRTKGNGLTTLNPKPPLKASFTLRQHSQRDMSVGFLLRSTWTNGWEMIRMKGDDFQTLEIGASKKIRGSPSLGSPPRKMIVFGGLLSHSPYFQKLPAISLALFRVLFRSP